MRQCAFLTMDNPAGFVFDDDLAIGPLRSLGWEVHYVSWSDPSADWNLYNIVIPRTTWDYHRHLDRFLRVLEEIERSSALLANGLSLLRWNAHKSYLLDLEKRGVRIVPTIAGRSLTEQSLSALRNHFGTNDIIIKPAVGANADFTFPLHPDAHETIYNDAYDAFREREFLAQGFMQNVVSEGEYSLFYFNGKHSHTILKTPKPGDFRVQEEHGGIITAVKPEQLLTNAGHRALGALPEVPLYARADFVRDDQGRFCLMELELIEPALYFRMDPNAAANFAQAVDDWMRMKARG